MLDITGPPFHALMSWTLRPGSAVTVNDQLGRSFRARIMELEEDRAVLFVFEEMKGPAESSLELILLQALPDKERMEIIIEKATELGVDLIVPWKAERGIDLGEREAKQQKAGRWPDRAKKAAKQCRRSKIPAIAPFCNLAEALQFASMAEMKILLWENADKQLREIITDHKPPSSVALIIGPEGGLTEREVEAAKQDGFVPVSFGSRILRSETAAIVASSLIQYAFGDLG